MYHHIPIDKINIFERQIDYFIKDGWQFIDPIDLYDKKIFNTKKKLLLTFDDGFYSNKIIAKKILKKFNIKAIFFVPSKFVEMNNLELVKKFIKNNLKLKKISYFNQYKVNMGYKDLKELINLKHEIGCHTKNHKHLSTIQSNFEKKNEIKNSFNKNFLKKINFFSFPFGTRHDVDQHSLKLSLKFYDYVFMAIRGNNLLKNINKKIIFRDNMQLSYNKYMCISLVNGFFDLLYYFSRKKILKNI
jgi:peptidoglycan/xylan/chitin deacetylase (PgdA/CDA1 family)